MKNNFLFLSVILVFLFSLNLSAQKEVQRDTGVNLVPNPSFETLRHHTEDTYLEPFLAFRNLIKSWNSPTETTPDLLFNINAASYDLARTGEKMIGFLTHNPNSKKSDTWREYIQVRLDLALEPGEEYILEFWVKRHPQATIASNNIGALLSRIPFSTQDDRPITDLDLVVNEATIVNPGKPEWIKISKTFYAYGDERFLLIGNFFYNEDTQFKKVKNTVEPKWNNPYYTLDDVSLRHLSEPKLDELELSEGDVIRLDRIYFDFDKWDLLPASYEQLDELVALLIKYPSMNIAINGHTDSRGSLTYNEILSDNRSKSVYSYLLNKSIDTNRLTFKGYGETYPVDTNTTDEGRQNNRRVEFVVLEFDEENVKIIESENIDSYNAN